MILNFGGIDSAIKLAVAQKRSSHTAKGDNQSSHSETLMSAQGSNEATALMRPPQGNTQAITSPSPSQAETLMSTQDAKDRAETRAAAKGKGKEAASATTQSPATKAQAPMGPPAKPTHLGTPNKQQGGNTTTPATSTTTEAATSATTPTAPANTPASKTTTVTANAPGTPADVPTVTPQKRGPGRPRKPEPASLPPSKRPRGRPRNSSTPASNTRQRAREETAGNSESEYQGSDDSSSETLPPNVLSQYTAHVTILRTRLDSRGIPEQYSLFKSFWVPVRSSYFDGGASGPAGRFVYWDPLFITSVACPVCQQPLAIAAGGGWLDEPLSMRDEEGPCWIIGRRYVCTQCFAATEVAASGPSTADVKPKAVKIDFSSPVYYISWEKRFRELLPDALAAEFPTRVPKRAVKEKEQGKEKEKEEEAEEDAEGEIDHDAEEAPRRATKRARHCMKCGSKTCLGRMARSRCPNACYDCGSTDCNGRPKPNLTCKGEVGVNFRELNTDKSSSPLTEQSAESSTPAVPQSVSWPSGLPEVPPGFVLAIPYAVGADGKPAGTGSAMAYLVPQENVPGLVLGAKPNTTATEASSSTPETASVPTDAAQPAQPQRASKPKGTPRAKQTSQKTAAQAQAQAPPAPPAAAAGPPAAHPHPRPPHHPPPHGASYPPPPGVSYLPYPPHPPHSGGPEPGHYGGYYPTYGYPPPYGYGFYPPYPPHHGPSPTPGTAENNAPPSHPPYAAGPYSGPPGYAAPPAGAYTPAPAPHAPHVPHAPHAPHDAPPAAPANGYAAPPAPGPQQTQQYIAYQPPTAGATTTTPATKKRKAAAIAEGDKTA
ncbi:hypothetical protein FS749_013389 [Ceratobasidium sp. UAMH 11750]|nr:hypothetical protein FS749_013389 [Ceratobasidium sp. UAMH 11750]